ncbi:MAG: proline--tRNA ligase [archaeon]
MSKKEQEGITAKKEENFSEWFTQLVLKTDLADYTKVSGCIVLKPLSYSIWEKLVNIIDKDFKKEGLQNAYFPLFIPEGVLSKEQQHFKGFTPEVAWVTHAGNSKLNEKLAIRPTSETIIYETIKKWIRSYKDLPLRLNLWNNVVRWEFKHPVPFFRTREFLWNEGHTIFASQKQAENEGKRILKIYGNFLKNYMALPFLLGRKTDKEKFAGAIYTDSLELYLPNGKAIQGPDFHHDGQNFARAYDLKFTDKNEKKQYVWQNTFAITTRMLGIMFAIHSDNKGLVLPPKLAPNKIIIIPINFQENEKILKKAREIKKQLSSLNPILDERSEVTPGYKFNEWELKGIPLRIEIGPKDLDKKQVIFVNRTNNNKTPIKFANIKKQAKQELENIQGTLYINAEKNLNKNLEKSEDLEDAIKKIKNRKIVLVPLSNSPEVEDILKEKTNGAKTLNRPHKQPQIKNKKCIITRKQADYWVYIARSY